MNTSPQVIDPLPAIDHSDIDYEPFERNFYKPHEEIDKLVPVQVTELREKLGIKVREDESQLKVRTQKGYE